MILIVFHVIFLSSANDIGLPIEPVLKFIRFKDIAIDDLATLLYFIKDFYDDREEIVKDT